MNQRPMERGKQRDTFSIEPSLGAALQMSIAFMSKLVEKHPILAIPWIYLHYHIISEGSDEGKTRRSYKIWFVFRDEKKHDYTVCFNWTVARTSEYGWSSGEVMAHFPGALTTEDYDCRLYKNSWIFDAKNLVH